MATRRNNYNAAVTQMGDMLYRAEKQVGWHLTSDHDRMPFYTYLGQTQLPSGKHPCYPASIDTLAACIDYLNELKAKYNAHLADVLVHSAADATNTIAAADATDQASAITLANELRTDYELHRAGGGGAGAAHTHDFTADAGGLTVTNANHTHTVDLADGAVGTAVTFNVNRFETPGGASPGPATSATIANGGTDPGQNITGTTDPAGGGAGSAYHSPNSDNINEVTAAAASDLATLKTLTLDLVTQFRQHLFIGPSRLDEDMTFAR